jgi:molybdate transport system regulatory protein
MEVRIKHRIWIEIDGSKLMGKGHVMLLRAIEKTGSLSGASRETGISYRKTWRLISQINSLSEQEVVALKKGGAGGGGAVVTEYGKELLRFFTELTEQNEQVLKKQLKMHKHLWK